MKNHLSIGNSPNIVNVLSVSQIEEDHAFLENSFAHYAAWTQYTESKWALYRSASLTSALRVLRKSVVPIILCEKDVPGTWRELLAQVTLLSNPSFVIVTSRLADDRLWAEALNVGAYDVLAKPFDLNEVIRVVSLAWLHWQEKNCMPSQTTRALTRAAS